MVILRSILIFFLKIWAKCFVGLELQGINNIKAKEGNYLFLCTHSGVWDVIFVGLYLPRSFYLIDPPSSTSFFSKLFLKTVDYQVINYQNNRDTDKVISLLQNKKSVVMFPEGRISPSGKLMAIRPEVAVICQAVNPNIIPVGISRTPNSYLLGRSKIKVIFDKPSQLLAVGSKKNASELICLQVYDLLRKALFKGYNLETNIFHRLLQARHYFQASQVVVDDINFAPFSYRRFLASSLILARYFKKAVSSQSNIAILLPNSAAFSITFFALQAIAKVAVLLNFSAGLANLRHSLSLTNTNTIITARRFAVRPEIAALVDDLAHDYRIIYLEDIRQSLNWQSKILALLARLWPRFLYQVIDKQVDPARVAVILFTSGSEAMPKAVQLSHRNILANAAQIDCHLDFSAKDTLFSVLPLFHSFGLMAGVILPVFYGIKVFQYPSPLHYKLVSEYVALSNSSILIGTSTFLQKWAQFGLSHNFNSLRLVVAGAEKLQPTVSNYYQQTLGIKVLEGYGTTEASPVISLNNHVYNKPGTVGRALVSLECLLRDLPDFKHGQELLLKGPNLMLGYWGEKPLTSKNNIEWYASGDLVTLDEFGYINIVGRKKRFVKIAGEMLSLQLVEEICLQLSEQNIHAAMAVDQPGLGERIVVYSTDQHLKLSSIQSRLRKLGYSMLLKPQRLIFLSEIPIFATGKINYPKLESLLRKNNYFM